MVLVPALVYLLGMSQHKAQGTSLAVIIPTALAGTFYYGFSGHIDPNVAVWVALGGTAGAYMGSFAAGRISEKNLKTIYAVFLLLVGIKMFF
ncbi:MAG: sulfite exporter TauE/SafE family protein [Candidatus Margulisiibacteriota bacterium]